MLSRVADALFWMSRYYERAENTARLIDVNINMMLDMGHVLGDPSMGEAGSSARYWNPIIGIATPYEEFPVALWAHYAGKRHRMAHFRRRQPELDHRVYSTRA
jgi:hypothetical protein